MIELLFSSFRRGNHTVKVRFLLLGVVLALLLSSCAPSVVELVHKKHYQAAQRKIQRELAKNPNDDYYNHLLGVIYRDTGQYVIAARQFEKAIRVNPYVPQYYLDYAFMLTQYIDPPHPTNYEQAIRLLNECLRIDPQNYPALRELMITYYTQRQYHDVIRTAETLLQLHRCDMDAIQFRGKAISALRRWDSAVAHYRWALQECQEEKFRFQLAEAQERLGSDYDAMVQWKNYRERLGEMVVYPDTSLCVAERRLFRLQERNRDWLKAQNEQPILELRSPSICENIDGGYADLHFTILNPYSISDFTVYRNDQQVIIPAETKTGILRQLNQSATGTYDLFLPAFEFESGKNQIDLRVVDALGRTTSERYYFWSTGPEQFESMLMAEAPTTNVFFVLIGIANYQNDDARFNFVDLDYSDRDAIELYETLRQQGNIPEENFRLLTNAAATRSEIQAAITYWLAEKLESDPKNVGVIYFSGHGGRVPDSPNDADEEDGFDEALLPYDWNPNFDRRVPTAIVDDDFARWIMDWLPQENPKVLIFDSCYSSGAAKPGAEEIDPEHIDPLEPNLPIPNCALLAASRASELSREDPTTGHGALTARILRALQSAKSDQNHDGRISLQEVYNQIYPGFYNRFGHRPILKSEYVKPDQIFLLQHME